MSKILISTLFILISTVNIYCQTIKELEYDLSWYSDSEEYGDKINVARKLLKIDPFNREAVEYICRYYDDRKIDSIKIFFDNLILKHPRSIEPYLLRAQFIYFEYDFQNKIEYNTWKIKYLTKALAIDKKSKATLYLIAETYYDDFMFPLVKRKLFFNPNLIIETEKSRKTYLRFNIKRSSYRHSADSALYYFYKLWQVDQEIREKIYFPIRQLECFLNKQTLSPISKDIEKNYNNCFFPIWYFANIYQNWQCDFTKNYLFEIESSIREAEYIKLQLENLNEHCLYDFSSDENSTIYRFTWLRSFHNPIAIRIEKKYGIKTIYWKIGKGQGGYKPESIKESGMKKITKAQWELFVYLTEKAHFDFLPNESYYPMTDGATWTLERKNAKGFKAHNTNCPNLSFQAACLYLIKLSGIKILVDDIY